MRAIPIGIVVAVSMTGGTAQAGLSDCSFEEGHNRAGSHANIGDGFVTYEQSYKTQNSAQDQHVLENCRSGQRLITVMADHIEGEAGRHNDVRDTFQAVRKSQIEFSPKKVRTHLRGMGITSDLSQWAHQSCACAIAYPELRGDKTEYQVRN